ncbi:hypothetical protein PHISCL_05013 [Aspergillus sclerotialis]|uniref:Uncharacterized protein n=1 Tax=Aspergillus sclerotialis TaxID=2070753 RepID=A0A3A2ZHG7_9EURO|nr:hypothetical protein PHISCL_05013 [Aspergillus sclerotialis]
MKGFKKLFGSKASEATDENSPLSQPTLPPGFYGNFPPSFSIYFTGTSVDKKHDNFLLATANNGALTPLYAFSIHKGVVKHQITLYSGPDCTCAPLALAGNEKHFRSTSIIALPASTAGSSGTTNQIIRLKDCSSVRYESFSFSIVASPPKSDTPQSTEEFVWKSSDRLKPEPGKPFECTLVRRGKNNSTDKDEIVGLWTEESSPEKDSKLGTVHFQGSGTTGELGEPWALAAVISLLRISQVRWEMAVVVEGMAKAAEKLITAGVAVAV